MGILNVTPDSFSDGGQFFATDCAVQRGLRMVAEGADIVDVGGESTRPGAARVEPNEELRRVLPVVTELAASGVRVSIDTTRATVAAAAIEAGARWINDVSGGRADPGMTAVVRETGLPYVVMHSRGPSATMASRACYAEVVTDVITELGEQVERLCAQGVAREQLVLDPGLGFAKNADHNWELLARLRGFIDLGPVLVGASRKSFLAAQEIAAPGDGEHSRDAASLAVVTLAAAAGVHTVRVHDVARAAAAVGVVAAMGGSPDSIPAFASSNR